MQSKDINREGSSRKHNAKQEQLKISESDGPCCFLACLKVAAGQSAVRRMRQLDIGSQCGSVELELVAKSESSVESDWLILSRGASPTHHTFTWLPAFQSLLLFE